MSESGETAGGAQPDPAPEKLRRGNRRTAVFVATFAITVFSLLTGYRFLVGTEANAWYLFQVARNASQVLSLVGARTELEGLSEVLGTPPQQVRAERAAWARGDKEPTPQDLEQASDAPLSEWEQYIYRFEKKREATGSSTLGPRVYLLLRHTPVSDLQEARQRLDVFTRQSKYLPPSEARKTEQKALEAEVSALAKKVAELPPLPKGERRTPYFFSFTVISECSAIEVMAIFFAAVISFPTTWRKRLVGLVAGLPLMYLLNVGRLTCLGVIGSLDSSKDRKVFDFAHEYVWQAVYIVFVVVVWMIWIELVVRRRRA